MPGGDRTGPMGAGPRTGRAAGFCTGYNRPGYANFGPRGGFGYGRGGGRGFGRGGGGHGWRNRFYATGLPGWMRERDYYDDEPYYHDRPETSARSGISGRNELADLKRQAANLSEALDEVNHRIEELESKKKSR